MSKLKEILKKILNYNLDTDIGLTTLNYLFELIGLKDPTDLRRFSRNFIKIDELIKSQENDLSEHDKKLASANDNGHMSNSDKTKLNGIDDNANNYTLPIATTDRLGGVKAGRNITIGPDGAISGEDGYSHPSSSGYKHIPSGGAAGNFLKWLSNGVAQWSSIQWGDISNKPSSYPPTGHTHDDRYFTETEVNNLLNGKLGTSQKASDSSKLNGATESTGITSNTIVKRDSAGDITARLMRSTYSDENRMVGGVAFRINTSDNYVRFCNSPTAFKTWLNLQNVPNYSSSSSVSSVSTSTVANSYAVKTAYDKGVEALNLAKNSGLKFEIIWNGLVTWNGTLNTNKNWTNYKMILIEGGSSDRKALMRQIIIPNVTSNWFGMGDGAGYTFHSVNWTTGQITYHGNYVGGGHSDNYFQKIIGIK